jgi:phosphatidylserine/phosphatidylglycerophosphate/cardiolipin synthase-like enzyme
MSPQPYDESHIQLAIDAIKVAERSVDIAMYSFRDDGVMSAIQGAVDRGVHLRVIYHGASEDRKDPEGTRSAELEDMGVEVRWINKIMHHKFALIDGPHAHPYEAWRSTLVTGSGNWSWSAATKFDENTVAVTGDARLNLAMQQEFNRLWDNSRIVEWREDIPEIPVTQITDEDVSAAPGSVVALTSANFDTYVSSRYGPTFTAISGEQAGLDMLTWLIGTAQQRIDIASGHLRFKPIIDALMTQKSAYPDLQIRVYLDGQEYTSEWYFEQEIQDYMDCLESASAGDEQDQCEYLGAHYGFALQRAGIPVRYKFGSYRWDYRYAIQMHHKYLIIDESTVASGSYNISPNAEFETMENLVVYSAARYPELTQAFTENFETIWETGRAEELYAGLLEEIVDGTQSSFPIVFEPMALSWDEVQKLKSTIAEHCPEIDSWEFRSYPPGHLSCDR